MILSNLSDQTSNARSYGSGAISLLKELLKLDWKQRINAIDALNHPYFKNDPKPSKPGDIPQFEESHELDRKKFRDQRNAIPAAPKGGTVGMGPESGFDQNNSQGYQNGESYRNHHNGGERRHHHPTNGVPPPPREEERRRPAWQRPPNNDRQSNDPRDPRHALPPRPPPSNVDREHGYDGQRSDRDRDPRRIPPRGGSANIDTYIPSYSSVDRPPRNRDGRPPPPRDRERDDYRRRDDRDRALDYDERPRTNRTRSRSRSPMRDHRERSRDWDRDDRRDGYRR